MKKPWFGRRKFGWGWGLPQTWQGWVTLVLYFASIFLFKAITSNHAVFITLIIIATIVLTVVVWITSGKPRLGTWWDKPQKNK